MFLKFGCQGTKSLVVFEAKNCHKIKIGRLPASFQTRLLQTILLVQPSVTGLRDEFFRKFPGPEMAKVTIKWLNGSLPVIFFVGLHMINMSTKFHVAMWPWISGWIFQNSKGLNWPKWDKYRCFDPKWPTSCASRDFFVAPRIIEMSTKFHVA